MKVLVTGATGFVGSHLTERLVNDGYEVRALVRSTSDISFLKPLDVEIISGDITDSQAVNKAVKSCQQVYHVAAAASRSKLSKNQYYAINVEGTNNIGCAAIKFGVDRVIYCSSAGVYGTIKNPPVDENTPSNPNSFYRTTKLLGEEVLLSKYKQEGLPVVIPRLSSVYGIRSFNWLGLIRAISAPGFQIIGSGNNHNHLGYITDVIDGIRLCAEKVGIEGRIYLIGGQYPIKLRELVAIIAQELGIKRDYSQISVAPFNLFNDFANLVYKTFSIQLPLSHRYDLFLQDKILDMSKAQHELGYSPKVSIQEGMSRLIAWYREKGYI
ncbi:NAD-dependent epimerase/dehydratase family protein [Coleofasciculus sp. F4-SAH-05]|uniref:NAD-dependent epimerase/dehydratase family protein n=1 Tax=Coleofasciculus sp. F4-SAH-05 TaxID=3069525 RepID=UPI0032F3CC7B